MKRPAGLSDTEWAGLQAYAKQRDAAIDELFEQFNVSGMSIREALTAAYDAGNERKTRLRVPPQ